MRLTESQQQALLYILLGKEAIDFIIGGKITKAGRDLAVSLLKRGGPPAARGAGAFAGRLAGTGFQIGKTIALRHPVLTAGAVVYYAVKHRDEIRDLAERGWELAEGGGKTLWDHYQEYGIQPIAGVLTPEHPMFSEQGYLPGGVFGTDRHPRKRAKTMFNKAVGAGVKALKRSPLMGPRGALKDAKKTFGLVAKVVGKVRKKKKFRKTKADKVIIKAIKRWYK